MGKTWDHRIYSDGGGVVVGAGMGTAHAHQAVRLAAEVTHGLGQTLKNMQLEEEQGQEANVGGEGEAAYLDRLRVLRASVAQHHQQIDRLTNYFSQEHERVNLFSNQLHLRPRAVVVAAGMQADVQEMQQSLRQENAEQRQQNAALRTQVVVYAEALRDGLFLLFAFLRL